MDTNKIIRKVAIVGYNRIPFARSFTAYAQVGNQEMMIAAFDGLIKRYSLEGKLLGEVASGAVIKLTSQSNLTRDCVMKTKLDPATPACDLQQACDTGIETAIYIANKIALGQIDVGIAGGVDSISDMPVVVTEKFRKTLISAQRAKSVLKKVKGFLTLSLKDLIPVTPAIEEPQTGLSMGGHTEITAKYYGISRPEQDEFSLQSHIKMAKAYDQGFFDDMISPYLGLEKDNNLRRDTTLEKLSILKPAFDKENGTLTAGNSTPFTDGASCLLLASEEWAKANGLPVLAYITFAEVGAIEYVKNRQNLLMAPVKAADRMLAKAGLTLQDFDYYEIHEAFAAQVLATLKIWESPTLSKEFGLKTSLGNIDRSKLNVKGSSLAAAHPFAATGCRIIAVMAKLLDQKGAGRGFISICAARGQGITMILEK